MGSNGSKTRIPPEELSELLQITHFDQKELKKWYLGFIKDCPDGTLDKNQFIDLYSSFYASGNARKFASHVFRTFDVNADGKIGKCCNDVARVSQRSAVECLYHLKSNYSFHIALLHHCNIRFIRANQSTT